MLFPHPAVTRQFLSSVFGSVKTIRDFIFFNSKLAQFSNTLPGHVLSNSRIGPPFNDKNQNFGYGSILLRNV